MFELDDQDRAIIKQRSEKRALILTPLVGDFVRTADGELHRICVDHRQGEGQLTQGGSYHLFSDGYSDFSGGCGASFKHSDLTLTDEVAPGKFWIFHHGQVGAHRGVHFEIEVKVWSLKNNQ